MKQKIVIKVQMNCQKCRTKAMKIAAVADGVSSVAIEGADKDKVVVTGDGVDSANLTCSLKKKLGHATIVSVQELDAKKKPDEDKKLIPIQYSSSYGHYPPVPMYCEAYDPNPSICSIM